MQGGAVGDEILGPGEHHDCAQLLRQRFGAGGGIDGDGQAVHAVLSSRKAQ